MAVVESFTVEGFPELFKAMDELKEEIGKGKTDRIWRDLLKKSMQPVLDAAKAAKQHLPKRPPAHATRQGREIL